MKKQSFQRFSPRALMILGIFAGLSTCSGVAMAADSTAQPAAAQSTYETPVTVPVSILDALLQTSQLGMSRPAMLAYPSFIEPGRLLSASVGASFGGWKANGANIKSNAYSVTVSQDLLGRPTNSGIANNRVRLGVLGRLDSLNSKVSFVGMPEAQQHTKVESLGFYAQLQTFDTQTNINAYQQNFVPQDEYTNMFTVWGYMSHLSGNIVKNDHVDAPWKGWAMSVNASLEHTFTLYVNGFPNDEVGVRWGVMLKPALQVGFNKLNFDTIDQLKGEGLYSGKLTLNTKPRYYYQFGIKLQYQGAKVVQVTDDPVSHWNAYMGLSYRKSSAEVSLTLPAVGKLYSSAVQSLVQFDLGFGFTYKHFRTTFKLNNAFGSDHYHQHTVGLSMGYRF